MTGCWHMFFRLYSDADYEYLLSFFFSLHQRFRVNSCRVTINYTLDFQVSRGIFSGGLNKIVAISTNIDRFSSNLVGGG